MHTRQTFEADPFPSVLGPTCRQTHDHVIQGSSDSILVSKCLLFRMAKLFRRIFRYRSTHRVAAEVADVSVSLAEVHTDPNNEHDRYTRHRLGMYSTEYRPVLLRTSDGSCD